MDRKKILCMSDSPKLHTGFALVGREIFSYLNRTGKYDIKCIGWFHQDSNEEITYPIYQTERDTQGKLTQEDKYGHKSFNQYVDKFKPDLVWTLGDMWMVDHVASSPNRNSFKWIGYFPIDGHPSPSKWGKIVENMDVPVAYGKYGMEVIKQRAPKANVRYIRHGVDSDVFRPMSKTERMEARRGIMGMGDDIIILGIVARNQPRKAFDKLFEAYFYILNGFYIQCKTCSKITVFPFNIIDRSVSSLDICKHCGGTNVERGKPKNNVRLYIHGSLVDCGWDLLDLQTDFNLHGKILVNPALRIGIGVPEFTLNGVYNAFDIFTLPTRGEGFGLPILEAMSAGIPIVTTDYSAHTEWSRPAGVLIPPVTMEAEPLTNIRRAIIDMDLYVTALVKLIDTPALRKSYGDAGRKIAETMDWKVICKEWESLIDSVLYPDGKLPEEIKPSDIKYSLEGI